MKLIGTEAGRVVQLVLPDEVRPMRGLDLPTLFHKVAARYGFAKAPNTLEVFSQPSGAKFEHGRLTHPRISAEIAIPELSLFNDGVIATCADTDLADLLLNDFFSWAIESDLLRPPITSRPRQYLSNLIVQFDRLPPDKLERAFRTAARFDAALNEEYGWRNTTTLGRLAFAADPQLLPQHRTAVFVLERRGNVPYEQNYFWSSIPLRLSSHLRLLEDAEQDLASFLGRPLNQT